MLNHGTVTAGAGPPAHWLYVLHGIYGAGRNWASAIRRVVRQRPEWGAVLIDLRQHGRSQGFPPPHTVHAAARDLVALAEGTGLVPHAVMGHSFGGKVALLFAGIDAGATAQLAQVWVVDSTPDAREPGGGAWALLDTVRGLPDRFATRRSLVDALVARGVQSTIAQWLATNLEVAADGGYRWRFDLAALEALLRSFYRTDAWQIVERPRHGLEVHLVKAEQSGVLDGASLRRAEEAASSSGRTYVHRVAGGHWVNVENPAAIEALLVQKLPR